MMNAFGPSYHPLYMLDPKTGDLIEYDGKFYIVISYEYSNDWLTRYSCLGMDGLLEIDSVNWAYMRQRVVSIEEQ